MSAPLSSPSARLVGLSGPQSGHPFPIGLSTFNYQNLFEIRPQQGFYVLRAGDKLPVAVSGRAVTECVLEDGDVISVGKEEFEFRLGAGGLLEVFEKITPWRVMIPTLILLSLLALGAIYGVSQMISPLHALHEFHKNKTIPELITDFGGTPPTLTQRIGVARAQFIIAQRLVEEEKLQDGNLARAIEILDAIPESMQDLQPKPEVVLEAEALEKKAREKLDLRISEIKDAAISAFKAGRMDDVLKLLTQMLSTQPDPQDPQHIWAMEKFLKYSK